MTGSPNSWVIVVARLPAQPSRHRVAVWRELRRAGALPLGGGTWILPAGPLITEVIDQIRDLVGRAETGQLFLLDAAPHDEATEQELAASYTAAIELEWQEFLSDCDKYCAELDKEIAISKFTLAELEEEEQSLERLRRWHRAVGLRDRFGAAASVEARRRLDECSDRLDQYAELVYGALGQH